jgi:hypothetical protein
VADVELATSSERMNRLGLDDGAGYEQTGGRERRLSSASG